MNTQNPILDELELIAPTLINVPRTLLYSLQSGYFENLSTNILNKIKADNKLQSDFSILDIAIIPTLYDMPKGYFDDLADNIMAKIESEKNDLTEIIPIIPINPYQVSDDYFNNLTVQILEKISVLSGEKDFFSENVNKVTPYQIPVGYFNSLSDEILDKVNRLDNEQEPSIQFTKTNPYNVPVGYFNSLANEIINRIKEVGEGKEFHIQFTNANPYKVPIGYFNNLSNEILNRVKEFAANELELNTHFIKVNPYQVPVGYFEGFASEMLLKVNPSTNTDVPVGYFDSLPTILLQKIRGLEVEDELNEIAPLLNTVNKKPVNYVPAGYFETLEPVLPKAVPVKVIAIKKKVNWFKNAIAACLIGTLGFTAFQLMDNAKPITTIQTASNEEIEIKIPTASINVDEELSKVDDESLAKYLDNIEMPTEKATAHFNEVNSSGVDAALQNIPDETIQQHLEETGGLTDKKN